MCKILAIIGSSPNFHTKSPWHIKFYCLYVAHSFILTGTLVAHHLGFWTKLFQSGKFYFLSTIFLTFINAIYCLLLTHMPFISCFVTYALLNFYLFTDHQLTYFSESNLSQGNIFCYIHFQDYLLCCYLSVDSIK